MFGIINNDSKFCLALSHLVIIGKYFLYVKALNGKFYIFNPIQTGGGGGRGAFRTPPPAKS